MVFIIAVFVLVLAVRLWHVESKIIDIRTEMKGTNERLDIIIQELQNKKIKIQMKNLNKGGKTTQSLTENHSKIPSMEAAACSLLC